jgi:hypothetical protein
MLPTLLIHRPTTKRLVIADLPTPPKQLWIDCSLQERREGRRTKEEVKIGNTKSFGNKKNCIYSHIYSPTPMTIILIAPIVSKAKSY